MTEVLADHQNSDPECAHCGHVATDHPRGGACGAAGCDCSCRQHEAPELPLALQYILANREALERWEWRRKMRAELTLQHGELTDRKFSDGLTDEETAHLAQVRDLLDQLDETIIAPAGWRLLPEGPE
jgi:hypothetical protein